MKISIIGPSAGGKSVLARKLCKAYNYPRLEIDRLWFTFGGDKLINGGTAEQKMEVNTKIRAKVEEFMSENTDWVIEGTYSGIQPIIASQADAVILINRPLLARIYSHLRRVWNGTHRHPEVTKWQDMGYVKTIFKRWRKGEKKKIDELARQFSGKVRVLRSFKDIDRYVDSFDPEKKFS
jgi:adenylate kinase family enzyme